MNEETRKKPILSYFRISNENAKTCAAQLIDPATVAKGRKVARHFCEERTVRVGRALVRMRNPIDAHVHWHWPDTPRFARFG